MLYRREANYAPSNSPRRERSADVPHSAAFGAKDMARTKLRCAACAIGAAQELYAAAKPERQIDAQPPPLDALLCDRRPDHAASRQCRVREDQNVCGGNVFVVIHDAR